MSLDIYVKKKKEVDSKIMKNNFKIILQKIVSKNALIYHFLNILQSENWNEKWKEFKNILNKEVNLNHETRQKHEINKNIDDNVLEIIAVISRLLNE